MEPVYAVYNTEVPECIALFKTSTLLVKYLVQETTITRQSMYARIWNAANQGSKIIGKSNCTGKRIAIRNASKEQINILGDNDYKLLVDYIPIVPDNLLLTYSSNRELLYKEHNMSGKSNFNNRQANTGRNNKTSKFYNHKDMP